MRLRLLGAFMALGVCACSGKSADTSHGASGSSATSGASGGPTSGGASALGGSGALGGSTASGGSNAQGGALSAGASNANGGANAGAASGGANAGDAGNAGAASGGKSSAGSGGASAGGAGNAGAASGGKSSAGSGGANAGGAGNAGAASGGKSSAGSGGASAGGTAGRSNVGGAQSTAGQAGVAGSASVTCTGSNGPWNVIWSDEFNGASGSGVDTSKWAFDVGNNNGWGNAELEYYTNGTNNAALDGSGNLVITARKQTMMSSNYTSARIKTQGIFTFTYGRAEARIQIPEGQGFWPAFWMLGNDINTNPWPACGEVDIMENIGKEPNIIHGSMHGPGYSGGAGPTQPYTLSAPVGSTFHVFAVEWEQNAIRWYVDDTLYSTKTPSNIPATATWVFAHPFFLILNLAVGGSWPGNPDTTTVFPAQMLVDYVRVCQH